VRFDPTLLAQLVRRSETVAPDDLVAVVLDVCRRAGLDEPELLLADQEQQVLLPAPTGSEPLRSGEGVVPLEGTHAGRALRDGTLVEIDESAGVRLWVPVREAEDGLGVITARSSRLDEGARQWCSDLAMLVAQLVRVRTCYTDAFTRARRRRPMALAAEMQWSLLPPLHFVAAGAGVGVAGIVEPAYDVGGDAFDYALNAGVLHLAMFDAMGHGLDASLVAALAVGTYRHARRRSLDLEATAAAVDAAVGAQYGGDRFVTGQ
jgi:Stage II sporulation protein E (SpoIIE)